MQQRQMTKQDVAEEIINIVKDLNVFTRAANRLNLLVDSSMGPFIGMLQVSISEFTPAIADTVKDKEFFDMVEKRAELIVNQVNGFKPVDTSKLEALDDESAKTTIKEALEAMEKYDNVIPFQKLAEDVIKDADETPVAGV